MTLSSVATFERSKPRSQRRGLLQRKCACGKHTSGGGTCSACNQKKRQKLQRQSVSDAQPMGVPSIVNDVVRSPGQPLDTPTRAFMELRFGQNFDDVRIHTSNHAGESAAAVNARAYTVGSNIVFASGEYQPTSQAGRTLLAHELTHVVQQQQTGQPKVQRALHIDWQTDSPAEREASRVAERIGSGQSTGVVGHAVGSSDPTLHREADVTQEPPALPCIPVTRPSGFAGVPLEFEQDSAKLSPTAAEEIDRFVQGWKDSGMRNDVNIDGFASVEGTRERNWRLSCGRAEAVKAKLIAAAVPASRILTFAHGETAQFGPDLESNRRVTISLVPTLTSTSSTRHTSRVAAVSFLACAPCNPFTDDGPSALTPPASEPAAGFRMKHVLEASAESSDGIHIDSSSLVGSAYIVGYSSYCGVTTEAHKLEESSSGGKKIAQGSHGEGVEWQSNFVTQVGATIPPTLPGAPCGPLGPNPQIPPIRSRFYMRIYADGTRESGFVSASEFPFHYLYDDQTLKTSGGLPVSPAVDFVAWSTSTGLISILPTVGASAAAETGFKALRLACCSGGDLTLPVPTPFGDVPLTCETYCVGGFSVPIPLKPNLAACGVIGTTLLVSSCPTSCTPAGSTCSTLKRPSNP